MIISRERDHQAVNAVMAVSIVIMLVTLVFLILPKPTNAGLQKDYTNKKFASKEAQKKSKQQIADLDATISKQTWVGVGSQIGPSALAQITSLAAKHDVKLDAFRPQRIVDNGSLTQLPFLINVQGAYGDLLAFEQDIDRPATKLAVELLQMSSTDESSDHVTGTVGVEAYVVDQPAATPSVTTTVQTTVKTVKPAAKIIGKGVVHGKA